MHYLDTMASLKRLLSLSVSPRQTVVARTLPVCLVQVRGKKKQTKQKSKKDAQKEFMKDFVKRQEMDKLMQSAALKAAKMGDPFDPEMLNPARKRPQAEVSPEERERRYLLTKEWSRYRMQKHKDDLKLINSVVASRCKALRELKKVSPFLYDKALELDTGLFPFDYSGPTATPSIAGYVPPDPES